MTDKEADEIYQSALDALDTTIRAREATAEQRQAATQKRAVNW